MRDDIAQHFKGCGLDPLIRLNVSMDGHTYIYQYRRSQSSLARMHVKDDVELGKCDPYAGLILFRLIRQCQDATL